MIHVLVRADRYGMFRLTGSDSDAGRELIRRAHLDPGITAQSLVVVDESKGWTHSDAVIKIASLLPAPWSLLSAARILPRRLRDGIYNLVADHRGRIEGGDPACGMPPPYLRDIWMSRIVTESDLATPSDKHEFQFDFPLRYRPVLLLWGVRKKTSLVTVAAGKMTARFGPFWIQTPLSNIASVEEGGPYRAYRAIGVRYSWVDHGLTFGSTDRRGVCIRFHDKVSSVGRKPRHPGLTLTLKDPVPFIQTIRNLRPDA